ncbi:non-ribosomal peptide synthetase [Ruminiclostridium papyrosolvens]|uniref:non-ribosomal peptide synthetase n=1 Tax=Ruminiclostridium papyrosolvens TaxID=29362 RepID=UPI0003F9F9C9|nr:non-ribosomal peptide synthetase [Ruminiclostridium papyrosolvens]
MDKEYWLEKLSGNLTEVRFPVDYLKVSGYEKGNSRFVFDNETANKLINIGKGQDIAIYTLLTALLKVLIYKYTNQSDILVGAPLFTGPEEIYEYNNRILLRTNIQSELTYKEILINVKKSVTDGYNHQHYPFDKLSELLQFDDSESPVRIISAMENIHNKSNIDEISILPGNDITFSFLRNEGCIEVDIIYNRNLYKEDSINRIFECYNNIMLQALSNINIRIADIELISEEEKNKLYTVFNNSCSEEPDEKTIQSLFKEQVARTPDNIAVSCFSELNDNLTYESITYRELDEKSDLLAGVLRDKGVKAGIIVGLMLERSIGMAIGIMGILKAGGAYLPVDPEYPTERINFLLSDSGAGFMVTQKKLISKTSFKGEIIDIDDQSIEMRENTEPDEINSPEDLAYIIYTSGSTGKPKGVMIEHKGVVNFANWRIKQYGYGENDITLQLISASFDGFGANFYSSLLSGGNLIIAGGNSYMNFNLIRKVICDKTVTNMSVVPSMYRAILDSSSEKNLEALRFVVLAGEKSDDDLVELSRVICPDTQLINEYGPTENTIATTSFIGMVKGKTSIIGKPVYNHTVHIVNKDYNLMPVGVPGELCVSGKGLSRGYLNEQELTVEKFVTVPALNGGKRIYKTGDMAKWLPDGNIEFLGRMDEQIKIRGFRVELGEIESRLLQCEFVKEAVVVVKEDKNGSKNIVAYLTSDKVVKVEELREYLSKTLPDYMIPSFFIQLEKIPLMQNGKVDRKMLLKQSGNSIIGEQYLAPGNNIEKKMADIWEEVLGLDKVGVNDKFIDIGGDSMKAIRITMECEKQGIKLSVTDIFSYRTISKIAKHIESSNSVEEGFGGDVQSVNKAKESNMLKIKAQRDITTYLHRSLPLCAILADEENYPWYYQHYLQIFSVKYSNGFCRAEFLEPKNNFSEIFDETYIPFSEMENNKSIIEFIVNKIDLGYYVTVYVDEYHLPEKASYNKSHFVHPSLIYGYDNKEKKLMSIGFDTDGIFRELTFDYNLFTEAYEDGKQHYKEFAPWAEMEALQLLKPKRLDKKYNFAEEKFISEIGCHLQSSGTNGSRVNSLISQEELQSISEIKFGMDVYDVVLEALQTLSPNMITIDYRTLHLLYEHKKCIYERLRYVSENRKVDISGLLEEYSDLIASLNTVRLKFYDLEHMFTTGIGLDDVSQQELMEKVMAMIDMIMAAKNQESDLLGNIYKIIQEKN